VCIYKYIYMLGFSTSDNPTDLNVSRCVHMRVCLYAFVYCIWNLIPVSSIRCWREMLKGGGKGGRKVAHTSSSLWHTKAAPPPPPTQSHLFSFFSSSHITTVHACSFTFVCGFIQRFPHSKMIEYHNVQCSLQCLAKRVIILFIFSGQGWVDLEFLCYLKTAPATQQRNA